MAGNRCGVRYAWDEGPSCWDRAVIGYACDVALLVLDMVVVVLAALAAAAATYRWHPSFERSRGTA